MKNRFKMFFTGLTLLVLAFGSSELFAQGISINLGKTEIGRYMKLVGNIAGAEGEIKNTSVGNEYCAENVKTSMYFKLDSTFFYKLNAGRFIILNVEYYDEPNVQIKLVYDAIGKSDKEYGTVIKTTGTNQWKSFGFYLDDCYFGHRQTNNADFKLVASSGKMHINGISIVPIDYYFDFGTVNDSLGITQVERGGGDSKTEIRTVGGEEAIVTTLTDNYLYMDVDDSLIYGGSKNKPYLFVSVQYYDSDPTFQMRLQYDAIGTASSSFYKSTPFVVGKGWNCWRTTTFEINDAWFASRENGRADMRLQISKPGMAINRIMVGVLDKAPLQPLPGVPTFSSYKALESPVVDGDLKDWSWQLSGSKLEYATDASGRRTDEYYRTWSLDPKNVPVAEAGEPGVTDPGKPGLWDYKDLAGEVKCFWDDNNFYVSANITDNVVNVKGIAWDGKDGIGLYFDVAHNVVSAKPVGIKDDANYNQGEHFIFIPALDTDPGLWKHSTTQTGEALPSVIKRVVKASATGYILEASIPLSLIKDGVKLTPGVAGDPDNYNPLFGYVVNDADGVGLNSGCLAFGAPSDDDENWGSLSLDPSPLVDKGIIADFGATSFEQFIKQVEKGGDGAVTVAEKGGKSCVTLANGYAYMAVDDAVIKNGNHPHLFISLEYFDEPSTGKFRIQYDAATTAYKDAGWINLTGTNTWKTAIIELTDAKFNNGENGGADFRINSDLKNLILNQVRIAVADYWINRGDSTNYKITAADLQSDGLVQTVTVGGQKCHRNSIVETNARYFYHALNDTVMFKGAPASEVFLTVEYYDTTSSGGVALNYDSKTTSWGNGVGDAMIQGTNQWKLHTFYLPDAYFGNRENGNHDFRVTGKGGGYTFIKHVMIGMINTTTGVEKDNQMPGTYSLEQNYPNPFNPTTTIRYQIPESGNVNLKVMNILGQEVATLVSSFQSAGTHSINWDASKLSSGMYIYTVNFNNNTLCKKLMLLK